MKKILMICLAGIMSLSLVACNSEEDKAVDLDPITFMTDFEESIPEDERVMLMELDETSLSEIYGLDTTLVSSFSGRLPMMVTHAEEYLVVKVVDGKTEEVKEKILERQKGLDTQWSQYLPDQHEMVQNYKLSEQGDYIAFAIGYNSDKLIEAFDEATK